MTDPEEETQPRSGAPPRPALPRASSYRFDALLGTGGMGEVYRAEQLATGRAVAVKVLREDAGATTESTQRLLAEASAIARLKHRNVVELLDLTRTEDSSRPMIVLELVDAGDLSPWADEFPGWGAIRRATSDVLRGLAAAHGAQLVHADLKPSNLLVAPDGSVKISDFGIARWQNPLRGMPGPSAISGTPEYMAPEQLLPDGHVGPWTDLYALGVMLHEWLGVRTPFSDVEDLPSLMRRKLTLDPPPIDPKPGLEIPEEVDALARQLLSLEPRDRPRFAAQLRTALESALPDPSAERRDSAPPVSWFPSAHDPSLALPTTLPLIGRMKERRFLQNQIEAVQGSAKPRLVLLRGPAGIGKSHLALWGFGEVERRGLMEGLAAGFDFDGGAHGDGLRHAMRRLLGSPASQAAPFEGPWRWLAGEGEPFAAREVLDWIRSDRGFASPERAAELSHAILRAATRVRPVYLWLDDLLWSRDGAAELVDRLLEADDVGALIVGTIRAGTADHALVRRRLDRWLAHPSTSYIRLGPLGPQERAELASAVLPLSSEFARELGHALEEATPLEIVQALTHWHERGWLDGPPGAMRPSEGHSLATLRASTRDLFDERLRSILQRQPDVVERTLITGALLGDPFEADVIQASLPDHPEVVDDAIEWALLRGLWRSMPGGAMRFDHGLLRTAALDRLMHRPDAARLQELAAEGISAVHDLAVPSIGLRVSELWLAAGQYASATWTLLHTGRAIARAGALERARDIWLGVGEWIDRSRDPRAHFDHRLLFATIEYFASRFGSAERAAREALDDARALDDPLRLATAQLLYASVAFHRGVYARSEAIATELAEVPAGASAGRIRISILAANRLAELAGLREDFTGVRRCYDRIAELLPKAKDRALEHRALAQSAELALVEGQPEQAAELLERAIEGYREQGDTDDLPDLLEIETRILWARGAWREAEGRALARVRQVRELGDAHRLSGALVTLCLVKAARPDGEGLADTIERLLEAFAELPREEPFEVWGLLRLETALRERGEPRLADEVAALTEARRARVSGAAGVS